MKPVWVAATRNRHKLSEFRRLLPQVDLVELSPELEMPEETGDTFLENALLKARGVHHATGLPALADDSGLEVDALRGGAPGVRSARFAGEGATDEENLALLLRSLEWVPEAQRSARYRAVVVLASADGEITADGTFEGRIALAGRGTGGFGYDPAFIPEGEDRTVGEMTDAEKDAGSHRAQALRALWAKVSAHP